MRRLMLAVFLVLVWAAPSALAWGMIGHRIVCRIATGELNNQERGELNRLARLYRRHGVQYTSYAQACFFPDQIKDLKSFRGFRKTHFVNVPRTATEVVVDDSSCADSLCVIEGLDFHSGQVRTAANDVNRAEAFFFVGHWFADIHQPLHVSFADDIGGGFVPVVSDFYPDQNLHAVWDTGIIRAAMGNAGWKAYADDLQSRITNAERTTWLASEPLDWTQESYAIVLRDDVDYCERTNTRCRGEEHDRELTADYQTLFEGVVEQRLKQAGVRLAARLRELLPEQ